MFFRLTPGELDPKNQRSFSSFSERHPGRDEIRLTMMLHEKPGRNTVYGFSIEYRDHIFQYAHGKYEYYGMDTGDNPGRVKMSRMPIEPYGRLNKEELIGRVRGEAKGFDGISKKVVDWVAEKIQACAAY